MKDKFLLTILTLSLMFTISLPFVLIDRINQLQIQIQEVSSCPEPGMTFDQKRVIQDALNVLTAIREEKGQKMNEIWGRLAWQDLNAEQQEALNPMLSQEAKDLLSDPSRAPQLANAQAEWQAIDRVINNLWLAAGL